MDQSRLIRLKEKASRIINEEKRATVLGTQKSLLVSLEMYKNLI